MTQAYSNPEREEETTSLPDVETFYVSETEAACNREMVNKYHCSEEDQNLTQAGWYWWTCFPGCLPDSEPSGPFDTEEEAIADAQDID